MKRFLRSLVKLWAIFADTLQVVGFDWNRATVASGAVVAAGTSLIGAIEGASMFQLAVGVPVAFAAVAIASAVARVWPYLGNTPAVKGVPPMVARELFTDADLRKRRDETALKQQNIWARLEIVKMQLARLNRRRLAAAKGIPVSKEESALRDELEELTETKEWADIESDAAFNGVMVDLYSKLRQGVLVAVGLVIPHTHGTPPAVIPEVEWDFLRFDDSLEIASGQGISYRLVAVRRA